MCLFRGHEQQTSSPLSVTISFLPMVNKTPGIMADLFFLSLVPVMVTTTESEHMPVFYPISFQVSIFVISKVSCFRCGQTNFSFSGLTAFPGAVPEESLRFSPLRIPRLWVLEVGPTNHSHSVAYYHWLTQGLYVSLYPFQLAQGAQRATNVLLIVCSEIFTPLQALPSPWYPRGCNDPVFLGKGW